MPAPPLPSARLAARLAALVVATALAAALITGFGGAAPASAAPVGTIVNHGQLLQGPWDVVAGSDGAMWFTNFSSSTIGRSTTSGAVTRFSGAGIALPVGITAGPDGALWFANQGNGGSIGRITTAGAVTTFTHPTISVPQDIAVGADGALWFTNTNNDSIGRITTAGVVTNVTDPGIDGPMGITAGPDGNLWFTSSLNKAIGRVTTAGVVTMFPSPSINSPWGITAGPDGNLWFADFGGTPTTIGRMTPAGGYTAFEIAGFSLGASQITAGPDGNLWFTSTFGDKVGRITPGGDVTDFGGFGGKTPRGIAAGPDGNLWFASFGTDWLGRMTTAGVITNVTGTTIARPYDIARGADGNLWFANSNGASIGRITPAGTVSSFTAAGLLRPYGIAAGPDGNLWFVDNAANKVGRITTAGVITLFGHATISQPHGIAAGPDGAMWFTNIGTSTIGRVTTTGTVTSFTGTGISQPSQITAGPDGALWFTNRGNASIGRITTAGVVTTFGGAGINGPFGIATGADGNLWFTNSSGNSVGRITPAGVVSNFPVAWANVPYDLAAGPDGNLWFTSYNNNSIGRITTAGVSTQFQDARSKGPMGIADGGDGTMWFTNQINWSLGQITAAIPSTAPGAPTGVSAVAGRQRATVSWTAPASNGGSPITGYAVTAAPGGATCATTGALTCAVTGLTAGTSYTFTVRATNAVGPGPASAASAAVVPWDGAGYHPVTPERILDSRRPDTGFAGKVVAPTSRSLQVTGLGGPSNVPANATAVVMNVTVADATDESFLTVFPTGTAKPNASNLNFGAGQIIPNLVTVKLGTGGKVELANAVGATHVIADVVGYYDDGTVAGDLFTGITPVRLLDSRTSTGGWAGPLPAGAPRDLVVRKPGNANGVPATATAVVANVTVTGGTAQSFVSAWPSGVAQPGVSNLNLLMGQTIPNLVTVKIGGNGAIRIANAVGSVHVIVDVVGYFDPTAGSRFHAINPTRVLDTRSNTGLPGPQGPGQTRALAIAGAAGTNVPAGATGLVANVTVAQGTTESFVSVFPGNVARPDPFSNLNFATNQVIPNLTAVGIAPNGSVNLYNHLGSTALVADAMGYFAPT